MGANHSSLTPLKNWDRFDPQSLVKKGLIFLCDTTRPQYPLEDSEWWLIGGFLNYNIVLQLNWFCREQGNVEHMCCPFSLCEACQIYILRVYIRVWNFQLPILLYDLFWKDVMYILGQDNSRIRQELYILPNSRINNLIQALTPKSTTWVLWKAVACGDEWLGKESLGKREDEIAALPTGDQAVPTIVLDWD